MQENTAVGWDPISIQPQQPLLTKLFILYMFFVITVSFVRWVCLLRQLWWLEAHSHAADSNWLNVWNRSLRTVQSSKRLVVTSCLLSAAVATSQTMALFTMIASQKLTGVGPLYGELARRFVILGIGLWMSVAVYVAFGFCEGILMRRKMV
jgi:hypothetical protein